MRATVRPRLAGACAIAAFAAACTTPSVEEIPGGPAWGEVTLVEDLRIGRSEGPTEYLFGTITDIVQHPDGTVFIADTQVPIIRRYDAAGAWMHDVGGQGQGPGEYELIQEMALTPDGNLAIWDPRSQRLSVVSPDGEPATSFAGGSGLHTSSRVTMQVDHEGNFYVLELIENPDDPQADRRDAFRMLAPDGTLLDTIVMPDGTPETPGFVLSTRSGLLRNFSRRVVSTMARNGRVVAGDNRSYSFEVLDGDEVAVSVIREDWEPVALSPEEHALWTDRLERIQNRPPPAGFVVQETPEYAPIPPTKPAFMNIWPGEDGTIWVQRYAPAHQRTDLPPADPDDDRPRFTWYQYPTFDVYSDEGVLLGTVELPHDTYVHAYHSDYLWVVQPDDDEEDVAVRYRIVKGGGQP